jgi:hypothetical protein
MPLFGMVHAANELCCWVMHLCLPCVCAGQGWCLEDWSDSVHEFFVAPTLPLTFAFLVALVIESVKERYDEIGAKCVL